MVEPKGKRGGLMLFWKSSVGVQIQSFSDGHINCIISRISCVGDALDFMGILLMLLGSFLGIFYCDSFPMAGVSNLDFYASDHRPILINLSHVPIYNFQRSSKHFYF